MFDNICIIGFEVIIGPRKDMFVFFEKFDEGFPLS